MLYTICNTYSTSLQVQLIISGIALFIGMQLIFKPIPKGLKGSYYYLSRKIMGGAIAILPLYSAIYYFTNLYSLPDTYASGIKLCGYYATTSLMLIAFLILIGEKIELNSINFRLYLLSLIMFPIYVLLGLKYGKPERTIIISNTLLFSSVSGSLIYFYLKYKAAKIKYEQERNAEVLIHLDWLRKSKYMLIVFACVACIAPTFFRLTDWTRISYMICALIIFIYIYESYNRFIIEYHSINAIKKINIKKYKKIEVIKEEAPATNLNERLHEQIKVELDKWIERKGYKQGNITIKTVCIELYTNRTYLSSYINSTYNCSFKVWIKNLRIEEAKRLLYSDKNYSIQDIAHMTGFSSQTSFIHVFRNTEGLPPATWKAVSSDYVKPII